MAYGIKGDLSVLRRVFSRFIRVETLSGNTGNVLAADNNGELVSRNVDFFLTGSTIFNNKVDNSTFITYTANTNTLIGTKLNITDFNSYSANTQNTINNNYNQFTAFTNSFNSYSANTNTLIGTKLDTSVFTAFTNSFYSYSSNTQSTINNNYSLFTGFTNSFNSYSANTLNTINNNYSQFTGFTNSFYGYSANTQNQLNNKYDKSGGTISGSVTILGNLIVNGTATTINTQNLLVYDPIIGLALVQSGSTNPTLDSGFIIERGLSGNTGFIWKEANKQFELGYTNNSYNDINVSISQYGDLKLGGLKTNYLYDSLGSTGITSYILTTTPTGVRWLSGTTTVDISGKLDTSVFTAFTNSFYGYTATTQTALNNKLNISDFNTFTGTTLPANYFRQGGNSFGTSALLGTNDGQSLSFETNGTTRMTIASGGTVGINVTPTTARLEIYQSGGTAMNIAGSAGNLLTITDTNTGSLLQVLNSSGNTVFEVGANNYVGITGSTRFVGNIFDFTNSSGNTGNLLTTRQGGVYWSSFDSLLSGSTIYTAFTNSFYGYTAATQNTINNNYSQFTAFTNSFYSYSANTLNTINNNYWALTSLTNTFYTYSAQTDSRLLFSSGTIGSTFRVNNNNQASGQYSTVSGGLSNRALNEYSSILGGSGNTVCGNYSVIGGGNTNRAFGFCSTISGGKNNFAEFDGSSVGGGIKNTASGYYSVVSGGLCNTVSSYCYSNISGGRGNEVLGYDSSIGGGIGNYIPNMRSSIGGGLVNVIGGASTYSGYWNITTLNVLGDVSASFNNNDEVRAFNPNDNVFYITTVSVANYNSGIGCTEITFNDPIGNAGNDVIFFNKTNTNPSGCANVIGGGLGNISSDIASVVTGGELNTSSGYISFVGGGRCNLACGSGAIVVGGRINTSSNNYSVVLGGVFNTSSGCYSTINGGYCNVASNTYSTIGAGFCNTTSAQFSSILGGQHNTSSGYSSGIGGGNGNIASGQNSYIGGGYGNLTSNNATTVAGGISNTVSGYRSAILGGDSNTVSGCYSAIGGGKNNTASGNNTFVFGCGLNGCSNNTTYVQSLKINGGTEALFTTSNTTLSAGLNSLYTIPTVYDGAFIDYVAKCGANYRSGQMMSVWSGGTIVYNETTTVDIGNTNPLYFCMIISGGSPVFVSSATTSGWCVKSIIKAI